METNIQEKLLNFHIEKTDEVITSKAGLSIFYEAAISLGIVDSLKKNLPQPKSNRGFSPEEYVMPLILMFCGGGKTMEDIREITLDEGLRSLCKLSRIPSSDSVGEWIRRPNLLGAKKTNEQLAKTIILKSNMDNFTLDTDATLVETEKECAQMTYKGFRAFSSLLSFLSDLDLCICNDYRNGAVHAGVGITEQIEYSYNLLKAVNKKLKYFRSDSGGYDSKVVNFCTEKEIVFTITADQDKAVKLAIAQIKKNEWKPLYDKDGIITDREYATAVHCMGKTNEAFTIIVQRWENPQIDLFEQGKYKYYAIATNDNDMSPAQIIHFHNKRGNSENYNKELKCGFGMEYTPSRQLHANAVYFELGILAYNLTIAVKRFFLGKEWVTKTIATMRWQLIFIAGKVVNHGRQLILKIHSNYFDLLRKFRENIYEPIPSFSSP